ncbi:MAG TPA: UDP-N-acetylmuramoyl-L-alanine--D-glutamate ligase [Candidatus Deferrimicrobiaceae bacterium]
MEKTSEKMTFVVGAGGSGLASAELLMGEGRAVTLCDERDLEAVERSLGRSLPDGIAFRRGLPETGDAAGAGLVVVSPGVPAAKLPLAALRAASVPVWGELELGFRRFRGRVTAVAGTNGKSTVTTLIGLMAERAFPRVFVGGNLGTPFVTAAGADFDWGVVEVSSFQLDTIDSFRPSIALLLNITEDHSDRYAGFSAYAEAKMAVFRNQETGDTAVINADDPEVAARAARIRADVLPFSLSREFPQGIFLSGEDMVLRDGGREERYPRSLLRIPGTQNVENAMAAIAAARRMGVPEVVVREVLSTFPGLPHRVEFVRALRGVSYYNDSKGTNVGAVLKALEGFSETVVLIAGGKDKGVDFRPLREPLSRKARGAVLIGQARGRMKAELEGAAPIVLADTLDDAVRAASGIAKPGDVVVFSPACSSFDMFKNFEERGEAFRKSVLEMPE